MRERLSFYLRDVRGFGYDVVNAVLAKDLRNVYGLLRVDDIRDVIARVESLNDERGSADFLAVSSAFKRIKNIIRQAQTRGEESREPEQFTELLVEPEGMRLLEEADLLVIELRGLIENRRYREALRLVGALRPSVDAFFDKPVVVLHDDPKLRAARLALVRRVFFSLAGIADFSEIVTG
jgi:glycyl-tRNA synthetase beta chain